jgi:hypothetical protein
VSEDKPHLGQQFHGSWVSDTTPTPLPGTTANPQGRLFAPVGMHAGDPWKLHPDNWMAGSDTVHKDIPKGDVITWHASDSSAMPRYDEHEGRAYESEYYSDYDDEGEYNGGKVTEDSKDRPYGDYGSVIGMHLGDMPTAIDRRSSGFAHPVRIPGETQTPAPMGQQFHVQIAFEQKMGSLRVKPRGWDDADDPSEKRWTDDAANFSDQATDVVEAGRTVPYKNDAEGPKSTSFRTLPETVRTWSEDVLGARRPNGEAAVRGQPVDPDHPLTSTPHPALVHLAKQGYNPRLDLNDRPVRGRPEQTSLFDDKPDAQAYARQQLDVRARNDEFKTGRVWSLRKPNSDDA